MKISGQFDKIQVITYLLQGRERNIMKKRNYTILFILAITLSVFTGCSKQSNTASPKETTVVSNLYNRTGHFKVTSASVNEEGVLKSDCTFFKAAPKGENLSPELSWDMVEGAACYAIYMYDADALNFLHWRLADVTDTSIKEGAITSETMYIGPFPPEGTHHYQIIVYALKHAPQFYTGELGKRADVTAIEDNLDIVDGEPGNVVKVGLVDCTVTRGEK